MIKLQEVCKHLSDPNLSGKPLLLSLFKAISVYTNFTGKTECNSISDTTEGLRKDLWHYQSCTELTMPLCSDGQNDMFEPIPWDIKRFSDACLQKFNVTPKLGLACIEYDCNDFSASSNIVFR